MKLLEKEFGGQRQMIELTEESESYDGERVNVCGTWLSESRRKGAKTKRKYGAIHTHTHTNST